MENTQQEIKALIVFNIDIGNLPVAQAEAFIERAKENFNKTGELEKLKSQGFGVIWIPLRPGSQSHIQVIPLSHDVPATVTVQKAGETTHNIYVNSNEEGECQK